MDVEVQPRLTFARESAAQVIGEIQSLMRLHWDEVGHYRDMPLAPDFERYGQLEHSGVLRLYTARTPQLMGYAVFLLGSGLHYRDVITAQESTIYLHPAQRRCEAGERFIDWVEAQLMSEGVEVISKHVKAKHDPGRAKAHVRLLQRRGYELQDYVLTKKVS